MPRIYSFQWMLSTSHQQTINECNTMDYDAT